MTQPSKAIVTGELVSDDEDDLQGMVDDDSSPERRKNTKLSNRIVQESHSYHKQRVQLQYPQSADFLQENEYASNRKAAIWLNNDITKPSRISINSSTE